MFFPTRAVLYNWIPFDADMGRGEMHKPNSRWSRDTEIAFLLALRQTGNVQLAARTIGRSYGAAYARRKRYPEFALRWIEVVDAQQAEWAARHGVPADRGESHARLDGFTPLRRRAFLRALSETGQYKLASERVGISETAARNLRGRDPDFARQCEAALQRSPPLIEQIAWERAVEGWEEPVVVRGEVVGTRRRYSESLLRMLLGQAQAARRAEAAAEAKAGKRRPRIATREETNAQLMKLLAGTGRRMRAEARAKQLAQAEAWEAMQRDAGGGDGDGWVRGGTRGPGR
jgi:hypothetical protein